MCHCWSRFLQSPKNDPASRKDVIIQLERMQFCMQFCTMPEVDVIIGQNIHVLANLL